jgi:glyoxylase I family protein
MAISPQTPGIHHLAIRTSDMARAKTFYTETIGFPIALEVPDLLIFIAGGTYIAIRPATVSSPDEKFNPFSIGLDHLALGCADEGELNRVAAALAAANVENTGVKMDETLGKKYVAFKDPDRINWEFYMI